MVPQSVNLTDKTLLTKISTSLLSESQKAELLKLLPQMNTNERQELASMIDHSVKELIDADPELQKKVHALNEEYHNRLHGLVNESNHLVREEFEKLEKEGATETMGAMEKEMDAPTDADGQLPVSSEGKLSAVKPKRRYFSKIAIALAGLLLVIGAAFYGLSAL